MKIFNFNTFIGESKKEKFPNIKTIVIDDFTVLIGKDAKSNDYLSIQMANENDLWFHAKGLPGSHVIIKVKENLPTSSISMQTPNIPLFLERCSGLSCSFFSKVAKIAAKNSKATGTCAVVYCKSKFLSKTSDMKPGQVSVDYTNSQEIEIEI